jgi:hypothetical protein
VFYQTIYDCHGDYVSLWGLKDVSKDCHKTTMESCVNMGLPIYHLGLMWNLMIYCSTFRNSLIWILDHGHVLGFKCNIL